MSNFTQPIFYFEDSDFDKKGHPIFSGNKLIIFIFGYFCCYCF